MWCGFCPPCHFPNKDYVEVRFYPYPKFSMCASIGCPSASDVPLMCIYCMTLCQLSFFPSFFLSLPHSPFLSLLLSSLPSFNRSLVKPPWFADITNSCRTCRRDICFDLHIVHAPLNLKYIPMGVLCALQCYVPQLIQMGWRQQSYGGDNGGIGGLPVRW